MVSNISFATLSTGSIVTLDAYVFTISEIRPAVWSINFKILSVYFLFKFVQPMLGNCAKQPILVTVMFLKVYLHIYAAKLELLDELMHGGEYYSGQSSGNCLNCI